MTRTKGEDLMYQRARRQRALDKGLCTICLKEPTRPGKKTGEACGAMLLVKATARRKKFMESGLCSFCGAVRDTEKLLCSTCTAKARLNVTRSVRKHRVNAEKQGLCMICCKADRMPGRRSCLECNAKTRLWKHARHGLTSEQLAAAPPNCEICNVEFSKQKPPYIDHDHEAEAAGSPNSVRGFLCQQCNTGIGMFKDNTDIIALAIQYLRKSKPQESAVDWAGFTDQFYRGKQWTKTEPELPN